MDLPTIVTIAGAVVGLIGGMCGIASLFIQRKQAKLLHQQILRELQNDSSVVEWAKKHDGAMNVLSKITSGVITTGPSRSENAYRLVFAEPELRQRIERHLGKIKFFGGFEPKLLGRDQLLNPVVQQVIEGVLDRAEMFKKEHTDWSRQLKLLPPK